MTAISPGKTIVAGVLVIVYEARSVSHYGARPVCVLVNTLLTHMVKVLGFVFKRKVAGNAYASRFSSSFYFVHRTKVPFSVEL